MPLRAIYDEFARAIPVHNATRFWMATRGHPRSTPALAEQRWALFLHTLRCFDVTFEPPVTRGSPTRFDAMVIPQTRPCPACGAPFFGYRSRPRRSCGCRATERAQ